MKSYWHSNREDYNIYNLESFTGCSNIENITKQFSLKELRYISFNKFCNLNNTHNMIYNISIKCIYNILNYKATKINMYFRNYKLRKINKLNNSIKRLHFNKNFINSNSNISDDLILKIFLELKILTK